MSPASETIITPGLDSAASIADSGMPCPTTLMLLRAILLEGLRREDFAGAGERQVVVVDLVALPASPGSNSGPASPVDHAV